MDSEFERTNAQNGAESPNSSGALNESLPAGNSGGYPVSPQAAPPMQQQTVFPQQPMSTQPVSAQPTQQPTQAPAQTPEQPVQRQIPPQEIPYGGAWRDPVYSRAPEQPVSVYSPGLGGGAAYPYQSRRYAGAPVAEPQKKSGGGLGGFLRSVCVVLVCVLLSAVTTYGITEAKWRDIQDGVSQPVTTQVVLGSTAAPRDMPQALPGSAAVPGTALTANAIYKMAVNQVVGIKTEIKSTNVFQQQSTGTVSGSGFIISEDGYILTNYHVIEYANNYGYDLNVFLHDGTTYTAKIIGYEADNDVAVIKIDAKGLNAVATGSSEALEVGSTIYAVGNPLGSLDYTMTDGIISALDRQITVEDGYTTISMFQISAAVNSGNSGGPVYDSAGEVVGIVSAKYQDTGVEGLGFAIPIDDAIHIATEVIENGYVTGKAYLGITVETVTSTIAEYYNMVEGAYVRTVDENSCAAAAGMKKGDIIIKFGDSAVISTDSLKLAKKDYKAGDTVEVVVSRAGENVTLTITLDEEKQKNTTTETQPNGGQTEPINPFAPDSGGRWFQVP